MNGFSVGAENFDSVEINLNSAYLKSNPPFDKKFLLVGDKINQLVKVIAEIKEVGFAEDKKKERDKKSKKLEKKRKIKDKELKAKRDGKYEKQKEKWEQEDKGKSNIGIWKLQNESVQGNKFAVMMNELRPKKKYNLSITYITKEKPNDLIVEGIHRVLIDTINSRGIEGEPIYFRTFDEIVKSSFLKIGKDSFGIDTGTYDFFQTLNLTNSKYLKNWDSIKNNYENVLYKLNSITKSLSSMRTLLIKFYKSSHDSIVQEFDKKIIEFKLNFKRLYNKLNAHRSTGLYSFTAKEFEESINEIEKVEAWFSIQKGVLENKNEEEKIEEEKENNSKKKKGKRRGKNFEKVIISKMKSFITDKKSEKTSLIGLNYYLGLLKSNQDSLQKLITKQIKIIEYYVVILKSQRVMISANTDIPIQTDESTYKSVDIGIAHFPGFTNIYNYTGFNLYFRPVNKGGKFFSVFKSGKTRRIENFKFWSDVILSRTSVLIAMPIFATNSIKGVKKFEFGNTLMVGVGFRMSRYMKLNLGTLWFSKENSDFFPLSNTHNFGISYYWGVSFDYDIFGNLNKVIEFLKPKKAE